MRCATLPSLASSRPARRRSVRHLARGLGAALGGIVLGGCVVTTVAKVTTTAVGTSVKAAGTVARGTAHVAAAALTDEEKAAAKKRAAEQVRTARELSDWGSVTFWEPAGGLVRRVPWRARLALPEARASARLETTLVPHQVIRRGKDPINAPRPDFVLQRGDVILLAVTAPGEVIAPR